MALDIHLHPSNFGDGERALVDYDGLTARAFRFDSGVAGLRLTSPECELVTLPYQGQQIWSARVGERELTMKGMFSQPNPTRVFLETYGGFFQHCGFTAMGGPSAADSHPLHGELPNAPYQSARLIVGQDERGRFIGLAGQYRHTVAFSHNYLAEPWVKVYAGSRRFWIGISITNLKRSPAEYMYLAHINFRPVDHARLVYSTPCTPQTVRARREIPSHIVAKPGYREFIADLGAHPEKADVLTPGLGFDPEAVFTMDYRADAAGWAHTMMVHPGGEADYVAHRPDQLPMANRWICRTIDQDAIGIAMPSTGQPNGLTAARATGELRSLPPGGVFQAQFEVGALAPPEVESMAARIAAINK